MEISNNSYLLSKIQSSFNSRLDSNQEIKSLIDKMRDRKATYKEVDRYAELIGMILTEAYQEVIFSGQIPGGLDFRTVAQIIIPTLKNNHLLITDYGSKVQKHLNENFGLGLKAVKPEFDYPRANRIKEKVVAADTVPALKIILAEPIINFSMGIVTMMVHDNCEFQYDAGLVTRIKRTASGDCCEWCRNLAGDFEYMKSSSEIFRRHKYCRCLVEYKEPYSKAINVHTNREVSERDIARLNRKRKSEERSAKAVEESRMRKDYRLAKYGQRK